MQLAQGEIAPHDNTQPDMWAGPAQNDPELIRVNWLI